MSLGPKLLSWLNFNTRICQAWSVWVSSNFPRNLLNQSGKIGNTHLTSNLEVYGLWYWRSTSRTAEDVFEILKSDRIENSENQSIRTVSSIPTSSQSKDTLRALMSFRSLRREIIRRFSSFRNAFSGMAVCACKNHQGKLQTSFD